MEDSNHSINALFEQLGLESSDDAVDRFISENSPIPKNKELHEAYFWTRAQSRFLEEMKENDADWAEVVDQLNVRMR